MNNKKQIENRQSGLDGASFDPLDGSCSKVYFVKWTQIDMILMTWSLEIKQEIIGSAHL